MDNRTSKEYRKRLKKRFRNGGFDGFLSHEVLELILTYALPCQDTRPIARRLLKKFGGLRGVFDAASEELTGVKGVGERAAVLIKLFKEAAGEYLKDRMMGKDVIKDHKDVLDYLNLTLSGERVEKFFAIYLNPRNEVLAIEILHEGTINQTVVYPRKAIEKAFQHNAQSVIFVHNHPSGDATPSNTDRQLAVMLNRAAASVDLVVHDHLVIGKNKHFSARENGWMAPPQGRFITALP
jgi:DNA repair protein RadC